MATKKSFHLPDLGEGLPDAEIVEWHVEVGDTVRLDEPLVSMETAKAVVDVPSPVSGKVLKLAGGPGDVILTGAVLAEFELDPNLPQRAEAQDTGHHHGGAHAATGARRSNIDSSARRAAISAPKPAVFAASCTITQRPVLATDSRMVSKSSGLSVATSMTSQLMPSFASASAASSVSLTCAPHVTSVMSLPSRST